MLVCPVNVSEGRSSAVIDALVVAAGDDLLDVHTDADHHRSVLTVVGVQAALAVADVAVQRIDLRLHRGAHPRLGAVDVVPFVPVDGSALDEAEVARDQAVRWLGEVLAVPAFAYGRPDEPTLPAIRTQAFATLAPDAGPNAPHQTAGATAVGARGPLVAYNLWLVDPDLALARSLARSLRRPAVRALGLAVGSSVQVSCNLLQPSTVGPDAVYDAVAAVTPVARAELVGLVPQNVLASVDRRRWERLDLSPDRTVEERLSRRR